MTTPTSVDKKPSPEPQGLMEHMVERQNMMAAYRQVVRNKGSAGIDRMTVDELTPYLVEHWSKIKDALLKGEYHPQAVRVVFIPKPKGGQRQLGIPTVIDRLIQQALHQALKKAQEYQRSGKCWVVDMDLAKFFDEVNHDVLMSKIAKRVEDKRILRLIRRYLRSGIMIDGMVSQREKGTPQGSPLSPLLSNMMLDELDKELGRRGHSFCRYADDCNIYVGS